MSAIGPIVRLFNSVGCFLVPRTIRSAYNSSAVLIITSPGLPYFINVCGVTPFSCNIWAAKAIPAGNKPINFDTVFTKKNNIINPTPEYRTAALTRLPAFKK